MEGLGLGKAGVEILAVSVKGYLSHFFPLGGGQLSESGAPLSIRTVMKIVRLAFLKKKIQC